MRDFVETHWGDLIGLLLLYTGITIALWAACVPAAQVASHLGESLVLAAMGILKLRGIGDTPRGVKSESQQHAAAPAASRDQ
jgi:hypothetical protein